jgi:uncharacterized cysteine cluster protein YcgN (CxxCxxCC family)
MTWYSISPHCFDALPPSTPSRHPEITPSQLKHTLTALIHLTLCLSILPTQYIALSSLSRHIAQKRELHKPEQHQAASSIKSVHSNTKLTNQPTQCSHTLLRNITHHTNTLFTLACQCCRLNRTSLFVHNTINNTTTTVNTHSKRPRHSTRSPTGAKNTRKLNATNGIEHHILPQTCTYRLNKRNKANPKHLRTLAAMLTRPSSTQLHPSFPSQVVRYLRVAQTPHTTPSPLPNSLQATYPNPRLHEPVTIPPNQRGAHETTTSPLTSSHPTSHRISANHTTLQPLSTLSKNARPPLQITRSQER